MRQAKFAAALLIAGSLAAAPALAAHGKAGLWKVSVTMSDGTAPASTLVVDHCMTAAEVASDTLNGNQAAGCSLQHQAAHGQTFTGELVCTATPQGQGKMQITYANPEHYTGHMLFSGQLEGHPVKVSYHYDGRWVSSDCGGAQH